MATGIPVTVGELVDTPTINTWARGYFRKTTAKTVNTTTTATDLLNGEFTLPAGALGTNKVLRLTASGDWKQNSGASRDVPRFVFKLGATTLLDTGNTGSNAVTAAATRYGWRIVCEAQNLGAANSQWSTLTGMLVTSAATPASADFTTGEGRLWVNDVFGCFYSGGNSTAVDTSASLAVVLNVINANNSANYETKLYGALVEII